jgi:hypothetical protein
MIEIANISIKKLINRVEVLISSLFITIRYNVPHFQGRI